MVLTASLFHFVCPDLRLQGLASPSQAVLYMGLASAMGLQKTGSQGCVSLESLTNKTNLQIANRLTRQILRTVSYSKLANDSLSNFHNAILTFLPDSDRGSLRITLSQSSRWQLMMGIRLWVQGE